MTNKELIAILQALPPDGVIGFSLGDVGEEGDKYRIKCAKAELICGECLDFLTIDRIVVIDGYGGLGERNLWADVKLEQHNLSDLDSWAEKFDNEYKKVEQC